MRRTPGIRPRRNRGGAAATTARNSGRTPRGDVAARGIPRTRAARPDAQPELRQVRPDPARAAGAACSALVIPDASQRRDRAPAGPRSAGARASDSSGITNRDSGGRPRADVAARGIPRTRAARPTALPELRQVRTDAHQPSARRATVPHIRKFRRCGRPAHAGPRNAAESCGGRCGRHPEVLNFQRERVGAGTAAATARRRDGTAARRRPAGADGAGSMTPGGLEAAPDRSAHPLGQGARRGGRR